MALTLVINRTFGVGLFLLSLLVSTQVNANKWLVKSPDEYQQAIKNVQAGDVIVLANGVWSDFEILFQGKGSVDAPITLTAETKGKVILSGQSNLRIAGEYLVVSGLVFKQGYTPSSEVISFRQNKNNLANNSRVTETVIDNYNNPDRFESDYWVGMYGKNNRFDHNVLVGKRNKGVTLAVRLNTKESQENHHLIDHNYFGPRPIFGSNGGETLRIGTSHYSLTNSFTRVENNYFDRCDGEVEIISVKSGSNVIRNNTFFESRGTLTLRHGNGNLVEGNIFFGNGIEHTGGIRIINRDQTVRNNYLEGLTGYRFGSGFTVMNGVIHSPINRYHQVVNAQVTNNSFVNVEHIQLAAGSDEERRATPQDSVIKNNVFYNQTLKSPFTIFDDISGINFSENVSNLSEQDVIKSGIRSVSFNMVKADNGLLYPTDRTLAHIGAPKSLQPIKKSQVGPKWYLKKEPDVAFDSGSTYEVTPKEGEFYKAVMTAEAGDVVMLNDGSYHVDKIISLNKAISIVAKNRGNVNITFGRSTLFEIANGGSLKLSGLIFDGSRSPDSSGNTLVRTKKWGMYKNYRFVINHSVIRMLDVNHSFHFFDSGSRAFANIIDVQDNRFENITGDLFRLNKEVDDLGIYNAEYVLFNNNLVSNVGGAVVKLYRGGRDESTFGPHLSFRKNQLYNVGLDKRNKGSATILIHGAQVANITGNEFKKSAPIVVEHTVGEPITRVSSNVFVETPYPSVQELYVSGDHTAIIVDNEVKQQ